MVVLADNQRSIAKALQDTGASKIIGDSSSDVTIYELITELVSNTQNLGCMSDAARQVTDGKGTARVVSYLFAKGHA